MKKLICILTVIAFIFTGCSRATDWNVLQMASAIADSQIEVPSLELAKNGDEAYENILSLNYGLDTGDVQSGAILAAGGIDAFEIAVLQLSADADSDSVLNSLKEYIAIRTSDFTGYFPEQEAMLKRSEALVKNGYALLLICPYTTLAIKAFDKCFRSAAPEGNPYYPSMDGSGSDELPDMGEVWTYDHDRIVEAWKNENWSELERKDKKIIDACFEIFQNVTSSGQTVPELELAIHDWMVDHMEYDTATLDNYGGIPDPDNDNPYGALVNGKGICEGYTRSFQLLMDLAGIECISVFGNSNNGIEYGEHAWNQVRLDGEWYVVDVTWDDPLSSSILPARYHHRYFNVTAKDIRNNHFWDEDAVPEATGIKYSWSKIK